MAERIRRNLEETFVLDGRPIHVTASIGIVLGAGQYRTADEVLRDADTAMFRAKAAGRDSYAIFDAQMHQHAINVLDLENTLRRAIERQELRLHYQPIVSLATSEICGFEALIRWMHPERGLIPPAQFIPIAEETGLIVQIGRWVIREACAQLGSFSSLRPSHRLHMNVNLSARQIPQPGFLDSVRSTLKEFGTDPSLLRFEITESVLLDGAAAVLDVLHQLRNLGAGLVLDDFGTGYSSLGYLLKYPVQELKIDRSFVSDPEQPEVKAMIARTIVGLARNLGMTVTAEGVETLEQAEWLRKTGCDFAQGFLFSRPVPAEQAMELITGTGYGPSVR
jgi:Amt family ammonium transporter